MTVGVCILLAAPAWAGAAGAATIEVQGVAASDPGKKVQTVPPSLAAYQQVLRGTLYGTFADAGRQSVTVTAGGKGSAAIGEYEVEIALASAAGGKAKVEITIKRGGKPIGQPLGRTLARGDPLMVSQCGSKEAPTILIIVLKQTE
jgi:hypothetical protein